MPIIHTPGESIELIKNENAMIKLPKAIFLMLLFGNASAELVSPPVAPTYNANGSFSVSRDFCNFPDQCYLQERFQGGQWSTIPGSQNSAIVSLAGRSPGLYSFRSVRVIEQGFMEPIPTWYYSSETQTLVDATPSPLAESLSEQLEYEYQIRSGDFDSNGFIDILVDRTSVGAVDGSLQTTIIWNYGSSVLATIPTTAQLAQARAQPLNPNISYGGTDDNFDRFADIVLTGLSSLGNSSFSDDSLILYANGVSGGATAKATIIDKEYSKFFMDIAGYLTDSDYYSDREIVGYVPVFATVPICTARGYSGGGHSLVDFQLGFCIFEPILVDVVSQVVGIGYDPNARDASDAIEKILMGGEPSADTWRNFSNAMRTVIGVDSFGFLPNGSSTRPNVGEDVNDQQDESQKILQAFLAKILRYTIDYNSTNPENWERHVYDAGSNFRICSSAVDTIVPEETVLRTYPRIPEFKTIPQSICTTANVFCWLKRYPAPRQNDSTATIESGDASILDGNNPIFTYVFENSRTIVNETRGALADGTPTHVLHDPLQIEGCGASDSIPALNSVVGTNGQAGRCSYVHRQVIQNGDRIDIRNHGEGYNPPGYASLNEIIGSDIFRDANQWVMRRMADEGACNDD